MPLKRSMSSTPIRTVCPANCANSQREDAKTNVLMIQIDHAIISIAFIHICCGEIRQAGITASSPGANNKNLRDKFSSPPLGVLTGESLLKPARVYASGHDFHSHIAAIVFQHYRPPGGYVLYAQHPRTAGEKVSGIVECVESCGTTACIGFKRTLQVIPKLNANMSELFPCRLSKLYGK